MKNKQGQTACDGCRTTEQPLLPFNGNTYCRDCAHNFAIWNASQRHMLELLISYLEEVTRAWWAFWSPHGVEVSDMRWDVEQAAAAFLEGSWAPHTAHSRTHVTSRGASAHRCLGRRWVSWCENAPVCNHDPASALWLRAPFSNDSSGS